MEKYRLMGILRTGSSEFLSPIMLIKKPCDGARLKKGQEYRLASKIRDTKTGYITETKLQGEVRGRDVLIFDDICDGGRTFIELAKSLKAKGAKKISLYITHGIFSKGKDVLYNHIDEIICFNLISKGNKE